MSRSAVRTFVPMPVVCFALVATAPCPAQDRDAARQQPEPAAEARLLDGLKWREVGPYRGGRCAAVAGVPSQRDVYYIGTCGGGVWKTGDGGRSWQNVSDGSFGGSIGAVAVSEWDPNVVYVGGGEQTVRGNVSHGDGAYRSTDAGRTWRKIGLEDSRHVCRLRIHPRDPDLVYAAVLGHLFGPNEQRGVFRSADGGASWKRVLFVDADTGAVDLAMDPTNPRILYASFWRVRRMPWTLESGGPGSGLWKSIDGGDSWTELTRNEGLPDGIWGISGITVSRTNPDNLYAIVESAEGGVFRSRDGGKTWTRSNQERSLRQRAWYYSRIYADPADEETVWVLNVACHRSKDGGRTFAPIATPHGDNHDLWIDPGDSLRMIESNDGGANVSYDGGKTWSPQDNQPTAQFYRVSTDNAFPYRLLGGQQDNSAVRIRSRSLRGGGISVRDWEPTAGGESGHVVAKPDEPDLVFGGSYGGYLVWVDHRTAESRDVHPWPDSVMGWGAAEVRYRFQWNFPLLFSQHDPDVLYCAANVMFRSQDLGQSWQAVSPDLTRDDPTKQGPSGGPITKDNTSVEYYCTIFAVAESPLDARVLWCGSDDGIVHVTQDGGGSWQNVTPPSLPEWSQINCIDAHPFEKGGCYLAATRYKLDDFRPYLYRTADFGRTWTEITAGIDPLHFTRAIRADPGRRGLCYTGTERGVYVSFDDGGRFERLQKGLPIVPITDLAVKNGDLCAATQGRGFWILDDLTPLRQLDRTVAAGGPHLFEPRPAHRLDGGGRGRPRSGVGKDPQSGVLFRYLLDEAPARDTAFRLDILTEAGEPIRTFERKAEPGARGGTDGGEGEGEGESEGGGDLSGRAARQLSADAGLNEFAWDLHYEDAKGFPGMVLWNRSLRGPRAVPGRYHARLTVGEASHAVPFEVLPDPRSSATPEDYAAQFAFLKEARDKLDETNVALGRLRAVKRELTAFGKRLPDGADGLRESAAALGKALSAIEEALYQTQSESRQDPLNFPIRLNDKLAALTRASGGFAPTRQAVAVKDELVGAIDTELRKLQRLWDEDLPALNAAALAAGVPAVVLDPGSDDRRDGGTASDRGR